MRRRARSTLLLRTPSSFSKVLPDDRRVSPCQQMYGIARDTIVEAFSLNAETDLKSAPKMEDVFALGLAALRSAPAVEGEASKKA